MTVQAEINNLIASEKAVPGQYNQGDWLSSFPTEHFGLPTVTPPTACEIPAATDYALLKRPIQSDAGAAWNTELDEMLNSLASAVPVSY